MRENISGILVITGCNKPAANEKQFSDSRKNSCFEAIATALSFLPRNDSRRRTGSSPGGDAGSGACKPNVGRSCDPPDRCLMGFDSLASLMHQDGRLREDVCVCTFNRFITLQDLAISQFNFVRLYASATLA